MDLPTSADLKNRREELDLTQSKVADRAGVSQPLIARIEGGDVDPRLSTLRSIVEALEAADGRVERATDVMHGEIESIRPDATVSEAVERMAQGDFSQLPVIEDREPRGSITYSDINGLPDDAADDPIEEHMADGFPTVGPDATRSEVADYLNHRAAVLVAEDRAVVGIVTEADLAARLS
ncbi:transcriptional regulator [Halobacteriales archaeon SW_7_68_16]|nr:MAG: transcriptional regulator [Halobacteriales archaeon SW_7_68_16]